MSKFYFLAQRQIPTYTDTLRMFRDEQHRLRLGITLGVGIMIMISLYVFFANSLASKNFALKTQGDRLHELKREHAQLEIDIASKKSLGVLEERVSALGLSNPERIEYLDISSSPVAQR